METLLSCSIAFITQLMVCFTSLKYCALSYHRNFAHAVLSDCNSSTMPFTWLLLIFQFSGETLLSWNCMFPILRLSYYQYLVQLLMRIFCLFVSSFDFSSFPLDYNFYERKAIWLWSPLYAMYIAQCLADN